MKDKILAYASILFAEKGTHFSMNELARELGMKAPSLYNYYKSKDDLILDLVIREIEEYYTSFHSVFEESDDSADERIKKIYYQMTDYYSEPNKAKIWRRLGMMDEFQHKQVKNILGTNDQKIIKKLKEIFHECIELNIIPNHDVEKTLYHFNVILQGVASNSIFYEPGNSFFKRSIDLTWESFWEGLKASK